MLPINPTRHSLAQRTRSMGARLLLWPVTLAAIGLIFVSAAAAQDTCDARDVALASDRVEQWLSTSYALLDAAENLANSNAVPFDGTVLQFLTRAAGTPQGVAVIGPIMEVNGFSDFCGWLNDSYALLEALAALAQPEEARGMMMVDERAEQNMALVEAYESDVRHYAELFAARIADLL